MKKFISFTAITILSFIYFEQITAQKFTDKDAQLLRSNDSINFSDSSTISLDKQKKAVFIENQKYLWTKQRLIKFKKGSEVKLDTQGNVIEGVLAENMNLRSTAGFINFEAGKAVRLNNEGKVISGFLLRNTKLHSGNNKLLLKEGSYVLLDKEGNVIKGRLAQKHQLECSDDKKHSFKADSFINFNKEHKAIFNKKNKSN